MMNNKSKLLFFFGSGADSDFSERLKSGQSFSELLLNGKYIEESAKLLGDKFKRYQIIHPNSTKVFLQTVHANRDEAREVLGDSDVDKCLDYINDKNVGYDEVRKICSKWYNNLFGKSEESNGIKRFFLENAVFFDTLDEKFNSLRNTDYNDNARRVINAYTQVFILMMKSVYQINDNFKWNYESLFNKLNTKYDLEPNEESYYAILKRKKINTTIITTNYTNLAHCNTGLKTIYLHGKLTWFEDLNKLTVFDCTEKNEINKCNDWSSIIPFILIPSGVKPIICTKQIEEYNKFIEELKAANTLFVVGYKFNSEDNHINSIIADWLRKGNNKLIYLNFGGTVSFNHMEWAVDFPMQELQRYDNNSLDKIINNIIVNEKNSREVFKQVLDYLEKND